MSKKNFIDSNPALNFLSSAKGANDESKSREKAKARKKEEQAQEIEEQIEGQLAFNDEGIGEDIAPIEPIEDIDPIEDEGKSLGRLHLELTKGLSKDELDDYIEKQLQGYSAVERKQIIKNEMDYINSLNKQKEEQGQEEIISTRDYRNSNETRSRRLQVLLQPTLYERLKEEADKQGRSVNDLIHGVLENYIEF